MLRTIRRHLFLLLAIFLMVSGFEAKNPSFIDTMTGIAGVALAVWVLFFYNRRKKEE